MTFLSLVNFTFVAIFGMILSAAFCDILWTWQKRLAMAGGMILLLLLQGVIYLRFGPDMVKNMYPLITHLPLILLLCIFQKKRLWPAISVLTAYLCCQLRRWIALLIITFFSGSLFLQHITELFLTIPLLLILMRGIAPSVRSISHYPVSVQCRFGLVPALYYGFDYLTRIYTDLLSRGTLVAVEFMPFVCSVAYLQIVSRTSTEEQIRSRLEQTRDSLNLQVTQAIREIKALRESQRKTNIYRHDLRHHMQYLSSCIENGRLTQAQEYIHEICSGIEANKITPFCTNEVANLIFSAFAARAEDLNIPMKIHANIPQSIAITENDLCVLLSNALENALHACQGQKEKGKYAAMEVSAYEKNGKIFLEVINSCDRDIPFAHGIPVTDHPGHGIGTRSICAIVEQYNGIYRFSAKNNQFTFWACF